MLINVGLVLFLVSLLTVPFVDLVYVKGRVGTYLGYYVTVALVALSSVANSLVQSSSMGAVGELPHRYMQSTVAGTAGSGTNRPICLSSKNHNQSHLPTRCSWLKKQCKPLLQHHNHSRSRIHHVPKYGRQAPSHSILQTSEIGGS